MGRHPVLTILMVLVGIILLLPGVCSIFFMAVGGTSGFDSALALLWIVCLLVAFGGVVLIRQAFRSPRP